MRPPSILEIIIIAVIVFAIGYFTRYITEPEPIITVDTTDVQIEYIPVPDTTLIESAIDSVNKAHRIAQNAYIRNIEQIATDRSNLETERDTLIAIIDAQRSAIRELTKLKVTRMRIEGCGLLSITYDPVRNQHTVTRIDAPPVEIKTITITRTETHVRSDYKALLYATGIGVGIGFLVFGR